ncbi:MAG: hypothetical protein WBO55_02265 [Rhizobiaceae bacterium]
MVLIALWDALRENSIEIPFSQRDITIRNVQDLPSDLIKGSRQATTRSRGSRKNKKQAE